VNCSEAGERLGAYADGELPKSMREELEGHLETCDGCRREAGRLTRNVAFLRSRMGLLAAGEPDAGFLAELKPRTKAEVAAAEREISGGGEGHRVRTVVLAVLALAVLGVVGFLVLGGNGEDGPDAPDESPPRADRRPPLGSPSGTSSSTRRPPREVPSTPTEVRPVPVRPARESVLKGLGKRLDGARGTEIPSIVDRASDAMRRPEDVATVRAELDAATEPETIGLLLVVLGAAPEGAANPLLVERLVSGPAPAIRSGAAVGLCRASRSRGVRVTDQIRLSVGTPDEETARTLLAALRSEADEGVRVLLVELLEPAAKRDEEVAKALVEVLRSNPDAPLAAAVLGALRGARSPVVADAIEAWISSGASGEDLARGVELLQTIDAARGARVALDAIPGAGEEAIRARLVNALGERQEPRFVEALVRILREDDSAIVRIRAVELLARLGRETAEPPLREAAEGDASREVRDAAAQALKRLRVGEGEAGEDR
jgi:anti-sigma factor RsiW